MPIFFNLNLFVGRCIRYVLHFGIQNHTTTLFFIYEHIFLGIRSRTLSFSVHLNGDYLLCICDKVCRMACAIILLWSSGKTHFCEMHIFAWNLYVRIIALSSNAGQRSKYWVAYHTFIQNWDWITVWIEINYRIEPLNFRRNLL